MSDSTIDPRARKGLVPLQIRLDPKGLDLAIRNSDHPGLPWRTTSGVLASDETVEGWYPLVGISPADRAVLAEALDFRIDQATGAEDMPALTRLAEFFGGER